MTITSAIKPMTKPSKTERLAAHVKELRERTSLESWNAFIREMAVPSDLFPALMTGRTQLLPKGRPLDASECQVLYNIIGTLMDTNAALREHTEQTGILVKEWGDAFKGLFTLASHIETFANLRQDGELEEEEQAA